MRRAGCANNISASWSGLCGRACNGCKRASQRMSVVSSTQATAIKGTSATRLAYSRVACSLPETSQKAHHKLIHMAHTQSAAIVKIIQKACNWTIQPAIDCVYQSASRPLNCCAFKSAKRCWQVVLQGFLERLITVSIQLGRKIVPLHILFRPCPAISAEALE